MITVHSILIIMRMPAPRHIINNIALAKATVEGKIYIMNDNGKNSQLIFDCICVQSRVRALAS